MKASFRRAVWPRPSRLIVRCYPRGWRRRYEEEMLALLEAAAPTTGVVFDLLSSVIWDDSLFFSVFVGCGW